jgi:hypothetical protein
VYGEYEAVVRPKLLAAQIKAIIAEAVRHTEVESGAAENACQVTRCCIQRPWTYSNHTTRIPAHRVGGDSVLVVYRNLRDILCLLSMKPP